MPGPFYRLEGHPSTRKFKETTWRTQGKPYVNPLPFRMRTAESAYNWPSSVFDSGLAVWFTINGLFNWAELTNRAMAKLGSQITAQANLALAIKERQQAVSMISKRAYQLVRTARQIRKGDLRGAARTLGITKPKGATRSKQFADNWLEYAFGWKPLIGDIHTAGEILSKEPPHGRIHATAARDLRYAFGEFPASPPGDKQTYLRTAKARVKVGCEVVAVNTDLYLMNQFGLTNPLVLAWESIPFSFIVDWFTGFGQYLESLTGMIGITIARSYTTRSCLSFFGYSEVYNDRLSTVEKGWGFEVERVLGLPTVVPNIPTFKGLSVQRGITAISLLIQSLKG